MEMSVLTCLILMLLLQHPTGVTGFIEGYTLQVDPGCGATDSSDATVAVTADLDVEATVECKDGYILFLEPVTFTRYTGTAKVTGTSSTECVFMKRANSRTYWLKLSIGYGDPGSFFMSYLDEFLLSCTYDENTDSDTAASEVGAGLAAPKEIQRQVKGESSSAFLLSVTDVLGKKITGSIRMGKKIKLVAEMTTSDMDDSFNALICQGQTETISCPRGTIDIVDASYGNRDGVSCTVYDPKPAYCHAFNSLTIVSGICNGTTSCSLTASNAGFGGDPCPAVLADKYLSVSYKCKLAETICDSQTSTISCNEGYIRIKSAFFGNLDGTTCHVYAVKPADCQASGVLETVSGLCNGKSSCQLSASSSVFGEPCVATVKYLDVEYTCDKGVTLCEGQTGSLKCTGGAKVVVTDASYGNRDGTTCHNYAVKPASCFKLDSLDVVKELCEEQTSCSVTASDSVFGDDDPCNDTIKYLTVSYRCHLIEKICESNSLSIDCNGGKIHIISATYGNHDNDTTCNDGSEVPGGCSTTDEISKLSGYCNGHTNCSVEVSDSVFGGTTCSGHTKSLVVSYICKETEVSATAVGCDAVAVGGSSRYAILRAGCGDGNILAKDVGFVTSGTTLTSPYFSSFKLQDSAQVMFECNFTTCESSCDGTSCTQSTSRRRKRDLTLQEMDLKQPDLEKRWVAKGTSETVKNNFGETANRGSVKFIGTSKTLKTKPKKSKLKEENPTILEKIHSFFKVDLLPRLGLAKGGDVNRVIKPKPENIPRQKPVLYQSGAVVQNNKKQKAEDTHKNKVDNHIYNLKLPKHSLLYLPVLITGLVVCVIMSLVLCFVFKTRNDLDQGCAGGTCMRIGAKGDCKCEKCYYGNYKSETRSCGGDCNCEKCCDGNCKCGSCCHGNCSCETRCDDNCRCEKRCNEDGSERYQCPSGRCDCNCRCEKGCSEEGSERCQCPSGRCDCNCRCETKFSIGDCECKQPGCPDNCKADGGSLIACVSNGIIMPTTNVSKYSDIPINETIDV